MCVCVVCEEWKKRSIQRKNNGERREIRMVHKTQHFNEDKI